MCVCVYICIYIYMYIYRVHPKAPAPLNRLFSLSLHSFPLENYCIAINMSSNCLTY